MTRALLATVLTFLASVGLQGLISDSPLASPDVLQGMMVRPEYDRLAYPDQVRAREVVGKIAPIRPRLQSKRGAK